MSIAKDDLQRSRSAKSALFIGAGERGGSLLFVGLADYGECEEFIHDYSEVSETTMNDYGGHYDPL